MSEDWKRELQHRYAEMLGQDDPVAWVREADAARASADYPHLAVRGPLFGVAALGMRDDGRWQLVKPLTDGTPQEARDGLHSMLWFHAKDDTDDRAVRRELLAAVAVLERDPANEVAASGVRYRVVRGEELSRSGPAGLEPPRPTDPEPRTRSWDLHHRPAPLDVGLVLDPAAMDPQEGVMAGALRLALRDFAYEGERFPAEVRADATRARTTHPEILTLPVTFTVTEETERGWRPQGSLQPTPHDARNMLHGALKETWPLLYEFDADERARYAQAAEEFRAVGDGNEVRVDGRVLRICRVERMIRCGADGPEPPRPSDHDAYGPMKMHPSMDEDGTIHFDA